VAGGDGVAVGTDVGIGVRVGGFFEAAFTDDVPQTSINTINPMLKSEVTMSDNLPRCGFRKFIGILHTSIG
jgi:hypothetical protein